jgi:two-component system, LytTR family, response regulator
LLQTEADFRVVSECPDGRSVVEFVEREAVDLILLDIQMPEMDGFQVVKAIPANRLPAIIFVTAFDKYALHAFEVHALDYLLKPVKPERMRTALNRVRTSPQSQTMRDDLRLRMEAVISEMETRRTAPERILLKVDGEFSFLVPEEIDWIESRGNYVELHVQGKSKLLRETLSAVEKQLRPCGFVRLSRSVVVNRQIIKTVRPVQYGEYSVELNDSTKLTLSRGYREAFFQSVQKLG